MTRPYVNFLISKKSDSSPVKTVPKTGSSPPKKGAIIASISLGSLKAAVAECAMESTPKAFSSEVRLRTKSPQSTPQ